MTNTNLGNITDIGDVSRKLHSAAASIQFPLDAFPDHIKSLITRLHEKQSFPHDFTGSSLLYAASIAAGNGFSVNKPFFQTPVLYLVLVAHSGQVKSHPLNFATEPLKELDKESFEQYKQEKEAYNADQTGELPEPVWKQRIVIDATPEALYRIHDANKLGLGLHKDEFASFFETFDRYSNNSDLSFWLSNWSLQTISKNRVKSEDYFIKHPFISIGGTIQTPLLEKLASNNRIEVGLLDRILFAFPEGLRAAKWSHQSGIDEELSLWRSIIQNIAEKARNNFEEVRTSMFFQEEAYKALLDWQHQNACEIDNANDKGNYLKAQMLAKLDIYAIRLSMLQSILHDPDAMEITKRHVSNGLTLIDYFKACGLKVREKICGDQEVDPKLLIKSMASRGSSPSLIAQSLNINKGYVSKVINGKK